MGQKITPLQAIKKHCLDCSFGSRKEVVACEDEDCNLYPFRLGKNPFHPNCALSDEEKRKMAEHLRREKDEH